MSVSWLRGGKYTYKRSKTHRSGLEDTIANQIKHYEKEVYEKSYIEYVKPASKHIYTPDFVLSNGIIIEAKGLWEKEDRQKHLLLREQYPNLDIRFVFSSPNNKIYKGSKTTYKAWCDAHGIKWASKVIPAAWFKEEKKSTKGLKKKKEGDKKS